MTDMMKKFEHKKSLGQHFLNSDVVPRWLCDAGAVGAGDIVFEIGPGTGVLTHELLKRGATVIALEADQRAIEQLEEKFPTELAKRQLQLHHDDARYIDFTALNLKDQQYKCVANIPYYLSGHLFRTLLESDIQPATLVFLVQKEIAQRIARDPKESLLSLSVKAFGNPTYIRTVGRGHFTPPPKVDSAIIKVSEISRRNFSEISPTDFFTTLHLGFAQKRKQLLGNLASKYDRDRLTHIFSTLNLPLTVRAEDIPLKIWLALVSKLSSKRIHT